MPIYSNVESYLEKHQRAYLDLLHRVGVNTERMNTVLVPPKEKIEKWTKDIDKFDQDEFYKITQEIYAHLFNKNFNDPELAKGRNTQVSNALSQLCEISAITNGKFTLKSGDGLTTIAECEISKDFSPAKDFKGINTKPICIVQYTGSIATNGKKVEYTRGAGEEDAISIDQFVDTFYGGVEKEKVKKAKCDNFAYLLSKGDGAFIECIAGLLVFLTKTDISEYDDCKKVVASLLSYDAGASYLALIQPYGDRSFLSDRLLMDDWAFAPAHSSDYVKIYEDFVACCGPKINEEERKSAIREARSQLSNIAMGLNFNKLYEKHFCKIFGDDFPLSWREALWAHELLFKKCYNNGINDLLAESYSGEDYEKETTFTNADYVKSCANSGVYSSDLLKMDCSPKGFVNSEYFFKYTLVAEPSCCKDALSKHSNPLDSRAKAFCQING
jgi:hypothetical protein